jgi:hypothetical protein
VGRKKKNVDVEADIERGRESAGSSSFWQVAYKAHNFFQVPV